MSVVSALVILFVGLLWAPAYVPQPERSAPPVRTAAQAHVQQHLDGALRLLETRDLRGLSEAQRRNRAGVVAMLREYRDAGRYPQNRDFAGQRVPYFVDPVTDVHCAVGYLMARTGQEATVRRIAAANNHVRVMDLADDADVRAWLDTHGLTLEEAARIQPWYEWEPVPEPTPAPLPVPSPFEPIVVPRPGPGAYSVDNRTPLTNETAMRASTGVSLGLMALQRFAPAARQSRGVAALRLVLGLTGTALAIVAPESESAGWRAAAGVSSLVNAATAIPILQRPPTSTGGPALAVAPPPRLQWGLRPSLDGRGLQAQLRWAF